jgi:hypothetical protein
MRDVPTTWEELLKWCDGHAAYSDRFIDFQRWIAEAEARATATERDRCLGLALVTPNDLMQSRSAMAWGDHSDSAYAEWITKVIRTRIAPPPPVDPIVEVIMAEIAKGVTAAGQYYAIGTVASLVFATRIAAAVRAMEVKNV